MNERNNTRRLMKSRTDHKVDGVLGGIAAYFGWDSTLLRILFVVLLMPSFGTMFVVYIVLDMIMPLAPRPEKPAKPSQPQEEPRSKNSSDDNWSDF